MYACMFLVYNSVFIYVLSICREDLRTANLIAAEAVTCLVIDRE